MVCVSICDTCIHQRENIDGWKCCCDAFPEGYPSDFTESNARELKECNNGIGYEADIEKMKYFGNMVKTRQITL